MSHLFAFGLGYSAQALADRLLADGWRVTGTCRSPQKAEALAARGIEVLVFDPAAGAIPDLTALDAATHIVSSIAPDRDGDPVLNALSERLEVAKDIVWTAYLSTTGVYGDSGGDWVDESSPTHPTLDRAKRRVAAENAWMALHAHHGHPVHIFRLAGIYGPGRSVFDTIKAGKARRIDRPGHLFGRIHVEDIATTLLASIANPNPGAIYNVCDDKPAAPADVTTHACALLGIDPPPLMSFEDAVRDMSAMGRTFWEDNRKVSNRRIRDELKVMLRHPDYQAGLRSIAEETGLID